MELVSSIFGIVCLILGFVSLDKYSLKRSDKIFKERVAYVLDEIELRKEQGE